MTLRLGKSFDRNYNFRLPFNRGYYDIGVFYNKKSTFLLFSVEPAVGFSGGDGVKVNMFKNLESSKFCETFINLHNYRKNTLDIMNQFKEIKSHYYHEVSFLMNETINLGKVEINDEKTLFDCLNIYGFTLNSYLNEFIFIITERQNIVKNLGRKIVRTSGLQIATGSAIQLLNEYHRETMEHKNVAGIDVPFQSNEGTIRLDD
jgi:hypothetical protein